MENKKISLLYRLIIFFIKLFYPKTEVVGIENIPDEPAVFAGNHAQMNGPIVCEIYFPVKRCTWCAAQMMHLKDVPAYAFQDFWSEKPRWCRWFYRLLSYAIAPLSVLLFNNAEVIGVYRDSRILSTFRTTVRRLEEGTSVVIFPEHDRPHNHIICDFQEGFVDVARFYHRKTGRELPFVPIYVAPKLKRIYIGKPVRFDASVPYDQEKRRILDHLMNEITEIACALPRHTVIPYKNISKKNYPVNIPPR